MSDLYKTVNKIVNSNDPMEVKMQQLLDMGLPKSDVRMLFYKELISKERAESQKRLDKRMAAVNKRIAKEFEIKNTSGQMKCLAIRQPWATLIVAGIKDVELRENMIPPCSRFLVASSSTRAAKSLDKVLKGNLLQLVNGYIQKGILPPYPEWPTGAIIGYADIVKVTYDEVNTPWADGHDGIKYVLKNAHRFDTPIYGKNKATPFFYNVEGIDDDHLPKSHVVDLG